MCDVFFFRSGTTRQAVVAQWRHLLSAARTATCLHHWAPSTPTSRNRGRSVHTTEMLPTVDNRLCRTPPAIAFSRRKLAAKVPAVGNPGPGKILPAGRASTTNMPTRRTSALQRWTIIRRCAIRFWVMQQRRLIVQAMEFIRSGRDTGPLASPDAITVCSRWVPCFTTLRRTGRCLVPARTNFSHSRSVLLIVKIVSKLNADSVCWLQF